MDHSYFCRMVIGVKTREEKNLLKQILNDANPEFLKWAIAAMVSWNNTKKPDGLKHIHGTNDRILPHGFSQPDISVPGGGHFMMFSMADVINEILDEELRKLRN